MIEIFNEASTNLAFGLETTKMEMGNSASQV